MQKKYKILSEGEVGHGILIEQDAGETIKINEKSKILKENEDSNNNGIQRILIDCILQKANVKNRNGRIYPKEVLVREVEKYKALIEANNSYGECVDEKTEIFTTNGWKFLKDISENEEIFTLNIETNQLVVENIQAKIEKEYNGKMYHIYNNSSIDMMLTPNHNMLVYDRYGKPYEIYTEDFVNNFLNEITDLSDINFKDQESLLEIKNDNSFTVSITEYTGKVYCVKTINGTWLMKRNGKIAWTKNCDHPDTPTISLKHDVLSHLVRSVRWDGDTLYGTIEIITSKGYHNNGGIYCIGDHIANLLERGYKLGISSRGLGSLKNIKGQNYVQNDFELLGWDLVSSPSTPDAYLFQQSKTISESYNNSEILNENQKKLLNFLDFSKKML